MKILILATGSRGYGLTGYGLFIVGGVFFFFWNRDTLIWLLAF